MSSITLIGAVKTVYTGGGKTLYRREYRGLKEDFDALPTDDDLASGSICRFADTSEYAEYFAGNKTWYLRTSSGSSGSSGEEGVETATDEEVNEVLDEVFGSSV